MKTPHKQQQFNEIFETLQQVVEFRKQPILESELRQMGARLVEYYSPELFRILRAIPGEHYFPAGFELEQRARKALGKPPLKGLTEDLIAKNEHNLVLSGQSTKNAAAGAAMMRNTLRRGGPVKEVAPTVDPLADLEDFGDEEKEQDPLAALADF